MGGGTNISSSPTTINKRSAVPIYYQLKEIVKENIRNEIWNIESVIPSERELSEKFHISRMTVRQALNELVNEGVLYRKRGIGTFIAKPKIDQTLSVLSNFTSDMQSKNLKPGGKIISVKRISAPRNIANKLQLEEDEAIIELVRLRTANALPMAIEKSFMPYKEVYKTFEQSLENKSLYQELKEKSNINLVKAKQTMEITYVDNSKDADLLDITNGDPVLLINRITYSDNSVPVEFVYSLYRADRYKFSIEMQI